MQKPKPSEVCRMLADGEIIVSKTDLKGKIIYGNMEFIEYSGYNESELLGKSHNIIRHPDMPAVVFKMLWESLKAGNEMVAYVKNLSKDGGCYWVLAFVTPSFNEKGEIVGYHSTRVKSTDKAITAISALYKELLGIEKEAGIAKSEERLQEILREKGMDYEEFILSL